MSHTARIDSGWPRTAVLLPTLMLAVLLAGPMQRAGTAQSATPSVTLVPAPPLDLPGDVDSNSPVIWTLSDGQPRLHVLTSVAGQPSLSSGTRLSRLGMAQAVTFTSHPGNGVWMEAVVADEGGTWYGYYHNEVPADTCDRPDRMIPRIGAARSKDEGQSWEDLGIVLEAPPGAYACDTANEYFVGGVGDVSVILDQESTTLYLFFSQYSRGRAAQGIAVGRLLWANRDDPVGRVDIWVEDAWLPPLVVPEENAEVPAALKWTYSAGTPLISPNAPWHDADPVNDAFWGAVVHWNYYLQEYVMLLNRAKNESFAQEGIYVSFAPVLDDPTRWTLPQRILSGGSWYPEVVGLAPGEGTDKVAGARARFFMGGKSEHFIEFGGR